MLAIIKKLLYKQPVLSRWAKGMPVYLYKHPNNSFMQKGKQNAKNENKKFCKKTL